MALTLTYTVHGVSKQTRPAVVELNGTTVSASVPEIEVELTDPLNQHGSLQLHFRTPEEQAYAVEHFVAGSTVEITV